MTIKNIKACKEPCKNIKKHGLQKEDCYFYSSGYCEITEEDLKHKRCKNEN